MPSGYGVIYIEGKSWSAHRLAHFLNTGEQPPMVRHHCDNPPCIEPSHLASGTHRDNVDDRMRRGRGSSPAGEVNGHAKLTWKSVREIRKDTRPLREIAAEYRVGVPTISMIRNGKTWRE